MQCDQYIACPYFIGQKYILGYPTIKCESVDPALKYTKVRFVDRHSRDEYKAHFCSDVLKCKNCPIHKMLDMKYGVNDGI